MNYSYLRSHPQFHIMTGDPHERPLRHPSYPCNLGVGPRLLQGKRVIRVESSPSSPRPLRLSDSVDNEAVIVFLADYDMELLPGLAEASTSVEYSVRDLWGENDVELLGLMPHEHDIGRTIRVRLTGGEDGDEVCLSWTPNWDFDWQQFYFYTSSVRARPDQTIRIDCTYDTRTRDGITIYGEGAQDEMCVAAIVGIPVQ